MSHLYLPRAPGRGFGLGRTPGTSQTGKVPVRSLYQSPGCKAGKITLLAEATGLVPTGDCAALNMNQRAPQVAAE